MKKLTLIVLLLLTSSSRATLQEAIAYIEGLIAQQQRVAIILMDMQTKFVPRFRGIEYSDIIMDQAKLIEHFAGNKSIFFLDVNYSSESPTLSELLIKLRKAVNYTWVGKLKDNVFEGRQLVEVNLPPDEGEYVWITRKLKRFLRKYELDNLFITECFDTVCVLKSTIGALKEGFGVTVDRDPNIILDTKKTDDLGMPLSDKIQLEQGHKWWENLKKKYPLLQVTHPSRYTNCSDE